eukprot:UN27546
MDFDHSERFFILSLKEVYKKRILEYYHFGKPNILFLSIPICIALNPKMTKGTNLKPP